MVACAPGKYAVPLNNLIRDDARAFITSLEQRGSARGTIKSYRVGADAMTRAVCWAWVIPVGEDPHYRPFEEVQPKPKRRAVPAVDRAKLEALPPDLRRLKLEALVALLELPGDKAKCLVYFVTRLKVGAMSGRLYSYNSFLS